MKHLFISLLLLINMATAFAGDKPIPGAALRSFEKTFSNAKEVNWSESMDLYKAEFLLNYQHVTAYYTDEGNLTGLKKNILSTQLPLILQTSLKNSFAGYWI